MAVALPEPSVASQSLPPFSQLLWIAVAFDLVLELAFGVFIGWGLIAFEWLPWQIGMTGLYLAFAAGTTMMSGLTARGRRAAIAAFGESGRINFVTQIAGAISAAAHRRRRRSHTPRGNLWAVANALPLYGWIMGLLVGSFAALLTLLASRGWVVDAGTGSSNVTDLYLRALRYLTWHGLALVPLLDIPKTINWKLQAGFTDQLSGMVLLAFKLLLLIPVGRFVVTLVKHAIATPEGARDGVSGI